MLLGKTMAGVNPLLGGPQQPSQGVQQTSGQLIEKAHTQNVADRVLHQKHGSLEELHVKPHDVKGIELDPAKRVKWSDQAAEQTKSEQAEKGSAIEPHQIHLWTDNITELDQWTNSFLAELDKLIDAKEEILAHELLPELEQLIVATYKEGERAIKLFNEATSKDIKKPVAKEVINELQTQRDAAIARYMKVRSFLLKLEDFLEATDKSYTDIMVKTYAELGEIVHKDSITVLSRLKELSTQLDTADHYSKIFRDHRERRKLDLNAYYQFQSVLDAVHCKLIAVALRDAMDKKDRQSIKEYATKASVLIEEVRTQREDLETERKGWQEMRWPVRADLKDGDHIGFSETETDISNKIHAADKALKNVEYAQRAISGLGLESLRRQAMDLLTQLDAPEVPKGDPAKLQNVATAVDSTVGTLLVNRVINFLRFFSG